MADVKIKADPRIPADEEIPAAREKQADGKILPRSQIPNIYFRKGNKKFKGPSL